MVWIKEMMLINYSRTALNKLPLQITSSSPPLFLKTQWISRKTRESFLVQLSTSSISLIGA